MADEGHRASRLGEGVRRGLHHVVIEARAQGDRHLPLAGDAVGDQRGKRGEHLRVPGVIALGRRHGVLFPGRLQSGLQDGRDPLFVC